MGDTGERLGKQCVYKKFRTIETTALLYRLQDSIFRTDTVVNLKISSYLLPP